MANRTKLTPQKKAKFLESLRNTANVAASARAVGVARGYMYEFRSKEPEFAKAWDDAVQSCLDAMEGALFERAVNGWEEPVFHEGFQCGAKRKFSDTAAIFLLKAGRPGKYRENAGLEMQLNVVVVKDYGGREHDLVESDTRRGDNVVTVVEPRTQAPKIS